MVSPDVALDAHSVLLGPCVRCIWMVAGRRPATYPTARVRESKKTCSLHEVEVVENLVVEGDEISAVMLRGMVFAALVPPVVANTRGYGRRGIGPVTVVIGRSFLQKYGCSSMYGVLSRAQSRVGVVDLQGGVVRVCRAWWLMCGVCRGTRHADRLHRVLTTQK